MHTNNLRQQLARLSFDPLPEGERKKILSLFHQPGTEYLLKDEIYRQLDRFEPAGTDPAQANADFERLWKRLESERPGHRRLTRPAITTLLGVAAALIAGLIIGILIPHALLTPAGTATYTAIAPKGSVSEAILPDSSHIFLNAGSRVRYTTGQKKKIREVFLDGEAWFDVKHSVKEPFIVHTGFYDVRVTGTRFNVKAYKEDQEVTTTLEKGAVIAGSSGSFKMRSDIELKAGEQLVYQKQTHSMQVSPVDPRVYSSWKENKLIFINMSLRELIILLERKYGVQVTVTDPAILGYHYDGTIKNETIIEVLNILQETLPIVYEINDQQILINKK